MKTYIKDNKAPLLVLLAGWLNAIIYASILQALCLSLP